MTGFARHRTAAGTRRQLAVLLAVFGLWGAQPAGAQVGGVSYTVSPVAERVFFSDNAGLEPGFLYGGELGLGFGRSVEVGAAYLFNDDLRTDFSRVRGVGSLTRDILTGISGRKVGLRQYGGNLKLNVGAGSIIPFLRAGAGVVQFRPEGLEESSTVYLLGGAGVQFSQQGRYSLFAGAENLLYRYNMAATLFSADDLAAVGLVSEQFNRTQVANWALRLGLKVYLGGLQPGLETDVDRAFRAQTRSGFSGLRLVVEPLAGTLRFDDALPFQDRHSIVGLAAGFDLGPHMGLRAFYWRGSEAGGIFDVVPLTAYGGEIRFNPSAGWSSVSPHLTLGGGYLDVGQDYDAPGDRTPDDQPFVTGGGGIQIPLSEKLSLHGGARLLLMSTHGEDYTAEPSNVTQSLMYTAGVTFALGGGPAAFPPAADREPVLYYPETRVASEGSRERALERAIDALESGDSLAFRDALLALRTRPLPVEGSTAAEPPSNISGESITIPVPEEGEIYLRFGGQSSTANGAPGSFGPPVDAEQDASGPLTADDVERIVRAVVQDQLALYGAPGGGQADAPEVWDQQLAAIEARLQQRLLSELLLLRTELAALRSDSAAPALVALPVADPPGLHIMGRRLHSLSAFSGGRFGEGPYRFLLGLRGDLRSEGSLRLIPETVLGVGPGKPSLALMANAAIPLRVRIGKAVPYAGAGVGLASENLLSGLGLVLNLFSGIDVPLGDNVLFGEFSTFDFFTYNRFLVGYRLIL